jgi:Ca2+-binding RTX toxin-like protein
MSDPQEGTADDDIIEGGVGGNGVFDELAGGDGDDVLSGGDGADFIEGGAGADT